MATTKTTITTWEKRPSVRPITASTTSGTTRATSTSPSTTPMTMLTSTIACAHRALSVHVERTLSCLMSSHTSWFKIWVLSISLIRSLSTSTFFLVYSFYILYSELYSELTTWSSWKACATPPTRGVTTPTTSPPPSQGMSPTSWLSASSTTHRVLSPALFRHRTKSRLTWHSASCSPRHTEDNPPGCWISTQWKFPRCQSTNVQSSST